MTHNSRTVFVTGIFDLLHSGHITFLQQAARYGDLYVAVGSDKTVYDLRAHLPVNNEQERLYMVQSVGCVHMAFVSRGVGYLDFAEDLAEIRPDTFVVNEDGNTPDKRALCESLGIAYVVLKREPHGELPPRSSSALRAIDLMPYRVDLAGGWHDQHTALDLWGAAPAGRRPRPVDAHPVLLRQPAGQVAHIGRSGRYRHRVSRPGAIGQRVAGVGTPCQLHSKRRCPPDHTGVLAMRLYNEDTVTLLRSSQARVR